MGVWSEWLVMPTTLRQLGMPNQASSVPGFEVDRRADLRCRQPRAARPVPTETHRNIGIKVVDACVVNMDEIYSNSFWKLFDELDVSLQPLARISSMRSPIGTSMPVNASSMSAATTQTT